MITIPSHGGWENRSLSIGEVFQFDVMQYQYVCDICLYVDRFILTNFLYDSVQILHIWDPTDGCVSV